MKVFEHDRSCKICIAILHILMWMNPFSLNQQRQEIRGFQKDRAAQSSTLGEQKEQ